MTLKFYTWVAKGLRLKVIKFWVLIPTFVKVIGEKLEEREGFLTASVRWITLVVNGLMMLLLHVSKIFNFFLPITSIYFQIVMINTEFEKHILCYIPVILCETVINISVTVA